MIGFNKKRLTDIRIVRGMSMEQLATALGVTKQMVSKYEDGKSVPQQDTLIKIAEALSIPKRYLFKESTALGEGSSTLFFRASSATPQKTREYAKIVSGWCYEISESVDFSAHPLSDISIDVNLTIPEKAMELRRQWGLGTKPIKNMVTLLESQGFNIFSVESPELKTEAYSQIINHTPVIVLNRSIGTAVRQRFSLAHELGHILLHERLGEWEVDSKNKDVENEAQLFAEYFLMPVGNFEYSFVSPKMEHLISLKREWLVSLASIIIHCEHIGLIDSQKRASLQKQINARGWQKSEPLDTKIKREKPYKVGNHILNRVVDEETFSQFFENIQLPIDIIESLCYLENGTLMKLYDGLAEGHDTVENIMMEFKQLTLADLGGNNYA